MKKIFTLVIMCVFASWVTMAQNAIPTPGMESWSGSPPSPTGWTTLNSYILGSCSQGTAVGEYYSGTKAAILTTLDGGGFIGVRPGVMATGQLNPITEQFTGGVNFTLRPDSLVGWYKYIPQNNEVGATGNLFLLKNSGADTVGVATFITTAPQTTWARFAVAVNYQSTDDPEKAIFIFTSGQESGSQVNTKLYIDELDLIYNQTVGVETTKGPGIFSYPNPVVDKVTFNIGGNDNANITFFNIIGGKVLDAKLTKEQRTINIAHLPAGTYVWQLKDANNKLIKTDKLVLTK